MRGLWTREETVSCVCLVGIDQVCCLSRGLYSGARRCGRSRCSVVTVLFFLSHPGAVIATRASISIAGECYLRKFKQCNLTLIPPTRCAGIVFLLIPLRTHIARVQEDAPTPSHFSTGMSLPTWLCESGNLEHEFSEHGDVS